MKLKSSFPAVHGGQLLNPVQGPATFNERYSPFTGGEPLDPLPPTFEPTMPPSSSGRAIPAPGDEAFARALLGSNPVGLIGQALMGILMQPRRVNESYPGAVEAQERKKKARPAQGQSELRMKTFEE